LRWELTNREIAERLGLAEKTVKNYVSVMLDKSNLRSRTEGPQSSGFAGGRARGGAGPDPDVWAGCGNGYCFV